MPVVAREADGAFSPQRRGACGLHCSAPSTKVSAQLYFTNSSGALLMSAQPCMTVHMCDYLAATPLYCSLGLVCDPLVQKLVCRALLGLCMRVSGVIMFFLAEIGLERRKASHASKNQITTGMVEHAHDTRLMRVEEWLEREPGTRVSTCAANLPSQPALRRVERV